MTTEELKIMAASVGQAMLEVGAATPENPTSGTGGGSRHRGLPEELRGRFITVRSELFQRGIYDPLLVRFDTATVPQASTREIAQRLLDIAERLG